MKSCVRCVMDETAKDIVFDSDGVCNYCTNFLVKVERKKNDLLHGGSLEKLVEDIRSSGRRRKYDCIVGVSGGVDSSYVLLKAVEIGLRPLAVHLDNGWNSELATHNIMALVGQLGVELYTHVVDWQENRDLQLSFFKANVVDIELLVDNAITALNYQMAHRHGTKYILYGTNVATEGMAMPAGWNHYKWDKQNIKAIHRRYGAAKIRTHPLFSTLDYVKYTYLMGIRWLSILDYMSFSKKNALNELVEKVGYKEYPNKHYESVFTRFYQGFILPKKFDIDKRKLHLSNLIMTGELSRDEALIKLAENPYPDTVLLKQDKAFVLKKLGFSEAEFDSYLSSKRIEHGVYGSEAKFKSILEKIARGMGLVK